LQLEEFNLRTKLKNIKKKLQTTTQNNIKLKINLEAKKERNIKLKTKLAQ